MHIRYMLIQTRWIWKIHNIDKCANLGKYYFKAPTSSKFLFAVVCGQQFQYSVLVYVLNTMDSTTGICSLQCIKRWFKTLQVMCKAIIFVQMNAFQLEWSQVPKLSGTNRTNCHNMKPHLLVTSSVIVIVPLKL